MHTALALAAVASAIAAAGAWAAPPLGAPQVPAARCLLALGALSWGVAAAAPEPYHLYGTLGGLALGVLGWLALGTAERRPGVRAAPVAIGMLVVGVALGAARHFEQPELALVGGAGWLLVALAAWPAGGARASAAAFPVAAPATHTPPAYDSLTGLPGAELLRRRVAHALRERGDAAPPVALLALEIGCDRVEPPELRGDLLEAAAGRLAGLLRAGDTAAHLEGPRFGVLAPGLDADALPELAERLLARSRVPTRWTDASSSPACAPARHSAALPPRICSTSPAVRSPAPRRARWRCSSRRWRMRPRPARSSRPGSAMRSGAAS